MHIGERQIGLNFARHRDLPCEHPVSSVYPPLLSYDEEWRWDSPLSTPGRLEPT